MRGCLQSRGTLDSGVSLLAWDAGNFYLNSFRIFISWGTLLLIIVNISLLPLWCWKVKKTLISQNQVHFSLYTGWKQNIHIASYTAKENVLNCLEITLTRMHLKLKISNVSIESYIKPISCAKNLLVFFKDSMILCQVSFFVKTKQMHKAKIPPILRTLRL